jgi:hypothetical protein
MSTSSANVLCEAARLQSGRNVKQHKSLNIKHGLILHLWSLGHNENLVLLQENRQWLGVKKVKGRFTRLLEKYKTKYGELPIHVN